jgi:lipopolysaccharide/colanic/teichoic acid biosynthesis glycosyltransferase
MQELALQSLGLNATQGSFANAGRRAPSLPQPPFDDAARRALDILGALLGVGFLLPVFLVIAALIKLQDGGPVFFAQERLGRGGRLFRCLKFRTMVVNAPARLEAVLASDPEARREWRLYQKLKRDPRITSLGRFLRSSSLDELPQLLNILVGDMSLVGPRPIVAAEIPRYAARLSHYCQVRPGLTGLWQVSGRNHVTYRRRIAMDCLYVQKRTLFTDLVIIAMTIPAVLLRRGSY